MSIRPKSRGLLFLVALILLLGFLLGYFLVGGNSGPNYAEGVAKKVETPKGPVPAVGANQGKPHGVESVAATRPKRRKISIPGGASSPSLQKGIQGHVLDKFRKGIGGVAVFLGDPLKDSAFKDQMHFLLSLSGPQNRFRDMAEWKVSYLRFDSIVRVKTDKNGFFLFHEEIKGPQAIVAWKEDRGFTFMMLESPPEKPIEIILPNRHPSSYCRP